MRKAILITAVAFVFFIVEYLLFNLLGRWCKPNLSVILIVFVDLVWGIRYGLFSALVSGIIKDSFSPNLFGFNIFSFTICAFLVTFIKKNIFHFGSGASRTQLVMMMTVINAVIHYFINVTFSSASVNQLLIMVMLPEIVTTTLIAPYTFNKLRYTVERYAAVL